MQDIQFLLVASNLLKRSTSIRDGRSFQIKATETSAEIREVLFDERLMSA